MTLVLLALVAAVVLAVICGGRPSTFGRPPVNHLGLLVFALVSLGTSLLAKSPGVCVGWLITAMLAMIWFGAANRGRPGIGLIVVGLGLNILVIIVNAGMPVSMIAVQRAGVPASRVQLDTDPLREELTDDTVLPWLSEAVPLALPFRPAVASPGDVLIAAGLALFVFTGFTGIGRTVPDRVLTPKERKAKRKARRAEEAIAAASETHAPVPVLVTGATRAADDGDASAETGSALAIGEPGRAEDQDRIVLPVGAVVPSLVVLPLDADPELVSRALADPTSSTDEDEPDAPEPIDPAVAAAAAAAAAEDAEFRRLKRQRKKRKRQARRRAESEAAAAAAAASAEDSAPEDPAGAPQPPSAPVIHSDQPSAPPEPDSDQPSAPPEPDSDQPSAPPEPDSDQPSAPPEADSDQPPAPAGPAPAPALPILTAPSRRPAVPVTERHPGRAKLAAVPAVPDEDDDDVVTEIRPRGVVERNGRPSGDVESDEPSPDASTTAAPEDRPAI